MNRIIHSLHPMYYPISCIWSNFLTEYLVNIDGGIDQFPQQHGLIALIKFSSTYDAGTTPWNFNQYHHLVLNCAQLGVEYFNYKNRQ